MKSLYLSLSEENQALLEKKVAELPDMYKPILEVLRVETNPGELKLSQAHLVWCALELKPFDVITYLNLFVEPVDPAQISMNL